MTCRSYLLTWVLWLLLWHTSFAAPATHQLKVDSGLATHHSAASSASTRQAGQAAACDGERKFGLDAGTGRGVHINPVYAQDHTTLHLLIYQGDWESFRIVFSQLSRQEHFSELLGAIQANDDRGMTIAHLLACAGRHQELQQLMDVLFRMQGDGVEMIRRILLESKNDNACKWSNCDLLGDHPGLYAHGTLHYQTPPEQVVLFGDVTPFECAAAHGHVQAMKLLIQGGVSPGKAFEVAQLFGLTPRLHQAIQLANADGFLAQPQVFLPSKQPTQQRQPHVRRGSKSNIQSAATSGDNKRKSSASDIGRNGGVLMTNIILQDAPSPESGGRKQNSRTSKELASGRAGSRRTTSSSSGGVHAASAGSSSTNKPASTSTSSTTDSAGSSRGRSSNSTNSTGTQQTVHVSEALDIAALLLLTGMLLLPVWSTLCLLWRRAVRKRAAFAEPARRIKQAMLATTTSFTSSQASSAADAASVAPGVGPGAAAGAACHSSGSMSSKKGKAAPVVAPAALNMSTARHRKANGTFQLQQLQRQLSISSSGSSSRAGKSSIPASIKQDSSTDLQALTDSAYPSATSPSISPCSSTSLSNPAPAVATACTYMSGVSSAVASSGACGSSSAGAATTAGGKQKRSKQAKDKQTSITGPIAAASMGSATAAGLSSSGTSTSFVVAHEPLIVDVQTLHQHILAEREASTGVTQAQLLRSSQMAVARAADASSTGGSGSDRGNMVSRRAAAAPAPVGLEDAARVSDQLRRGTAGNSKGHHSKASVASKGKRSKQTSAVQQATCKEPSVVSLRSVSAAAANGPYNPLDLQMPQLRAVSVGHEAQAAHAYATLIAPYTPSAASAASRPAIYQPPCSNSSMAAADEHMPAAKRAGALAPELQSQSTEAAADHGTGMSEAASVQSGAVAKTAAAVDDDVNDAHRTLDQDKATATATSSNNGEPLSAARAGSAAASTAPMPGTTSYGVPAATISMTSAAAAVTAAASNGRDSSGSAGTVGSCFSGPAALPPLASSNSGQVITSQLHMQLSCTQPLQHYGSSASACQDAVLTSSGSGSSSCSAGSTAVLARVAPPMSRKASDASSVASEASCASTCSAVGLGGSSATVATPPLAAGAAVTSSKPAAAAPSATSSAADMGMLSTACPTEHKHVERTTSTCSEAELIGEFAGAVAEAVAACAQGTGSDEAPRGSTQASTVGGAIAAAAIDTTPMTADAEVEFRPRGSTTGGGISGTHAGGALLSTMAQQQQPMHAYQQQSRAQELQKLINILGQHRAEEVVAAAAAQHQPLTLEQLAWLVKRTQPPAPPQQHQQQQSPQQQPVHAASSTAGAQQQWVASTSLASATGQGQQVHLINQPMTTAGVPLHVVQQQQQQQRTSEPLTLPPGMMALVQASKGQDATQVHQQMPQQQQKLVVFVPQQQSMQIMSQNSSAMSTGSPGQCVLPAQMQCLQQQQQQQPHATLLNMPPGTVVFSPAAATRDAGLAAAVAALHQQQQHRGLPIPCAPNTMVGSSPIMPVQQQLQLQHMMPLQGIVQSGGAVQAIRVQPAQVQQAAGPGVSFVAGQRMSTAGIAPVLANMHPQQVRTTVAAAAAAVAAAATAAAGSVPQAGLPTASQQLLAMAPGAATHAHAVAARQQSSSMHAGAAAAGTPGMFDWSQLASELAAGPFNQGSAGGRTSPYGRPVSPAAGVPPPLLTMPSRAGDAADAAAPAADGGAAVGVDQSRREPWLTVAVPEPPAGNARSESESAMMAAELDELLHQASQQLGWSAIPQASAGDTEAPTRSPTTTTAAAAGPSATHSSATTAAAILAAMPKLKPTAAEYQPGKGLVPAQPPGVKGTPRLLAEAGDMRSNHIKNLEALQLPDGFSAGD